MAAWLLEKDRESVAADAQHAHELLLQQEANQAARDRRAAVEAEQTVQRERMLRQERAQAEREAAEATTPSVNRFKRVFGAR